MNETINAWAIKLIQEFEGYQDEIYRCPAGFLTIGWGHRVAEADAFPSQIGKDEALVLLQEDITAVAWRLCRFVSVPLTAPQWGALISFAYNVGVGAFQRSTLRQKINREEHNQAASEFMRWIYCNGVQLPGLIRRRAAEAQVYLGDEGTPLP